jgi:hypothetical protein
MGLPDQAMREKVLALHIGKTFFDKKNTALEQQAKEALSPAAIAAIAAKTEGYSNRSLQGLVNTLFVSAAQNNGISQQQIDKTLDQMQKNAVTTPVAPVPAA